MNGIDSKITYNLRLHTILYRATNEERILKKIPEEVEVIMLAILSLIVSTETSSKLFLR